MVSTEKRQFHKGRGKISGGCQCKLPICTIRLVTSSASSNPWLIPGCASALSMFRLRAKHKTRGWIRTRVFDLLTLSVSTSISSYRFLSDHDEPLFPSIGHGTGNHLSQGVPLGRLLYRSDEEQDIGNIHIHFIGDKKTSLKLENKSISYLASKGKRQQLRKHLLPTPSM